jgi:hypothetical protein
MRSLFRASRRSAHKESLDLPCALGLICAFLLAVPTSVCSGDPTFAAPFLSFDVGRNPTSIAVGDFNGDHRLDLAVASKVVNTVSVLLGRGDGTFRSKTDYPTGILPLSVAIGEFNGDGRADLVVANEASSTVSILLGNGDGSLGAKRDFSTGSHPFSVAIGDLNGDGRADLAVAGGDGVSVLLGRGDGTFTPKADFVTGRFPIAVAIGDLNRDGRQDLAVVNYSAATISVLLGRGDGSFPTKSDYASWNFLVSVAIADLNRDGWPDLVAGNSGPSHPILVMLGNGDGSFGPQTPYVVAWSSGQVAIGDLNGDERVDLAVTNYGLNTVSVLVGNGDGTFRAHGTFRTGNVPGSMVIGDFSRDRRPDLAVVNGDANTISVLLGNGDGTFGTDSQYATGNAISMVLGDLNGDRHADLVTAEPRVPYQECSHGCRWRDDSAVSVLLGNADGTFRPRVSYATGSYPLSLAIGDFNSDGQSDLAVARDGSFHPPFQYSTVSVLLGNGDGGFGPKIDHVIGSAPLQGISIAIGEFNLDRQPDLAVLNRDNDLVSVLLGRGDGTLGPRTDKATGNAPFAIAVGDLNGDWLQDLVVGSLARSGVAPVNGVSVLLGNGDGSFESGADYLAGRAVASVAIGDLSGDGQADLAVTNFVDATVSVLIGQGDGTFLPSRDYGVGLYPVSIAMRDLNGDGRRDLAVANYGANMVSVLLGEGDGTLGAKTDFGTGTNPSSVAIEDLNGDGRPDLAVANFHTGSVSVLLNLGSETTCPSTTVSFELNPNTLNLRSMGRWMTAMLEPDLPDSPGDIDIASILLNESVPVYGSGQTSIGDVDRDGRPDLTIKFDQAAVKETVEEGEAVPVTIRGRLGTGCFEAIDTIRVTHGPRNVVGAQSEASPRFELHGAVPNPGRGLYVSFSLAGAEPATLTIYDIAGREVAARAVESLGAGRHIVAMRGAGSLAAGVYLVHLVQGSRRLIARAVIIE